MKAYYQDNFCTIYHGDCREILPSLPRVDLVLTDPPYGVDKAAWDTVLPMDRLHLAALKADTVGVMPGICNLPLMPEYLGALHYRWTLSVRISNGMTRSPVGFGNWIACMIYSNSESIHSTSQDATEIAITGEKVNHPCPKPLAAMKWLLSRFEAATILDPFAGSGTTLRAAKDLGKVSIGIEKEEVHCETIAKRLAQEVLSFEPQQMK